MRKSKMKIKSHAQEHVLTVQDQGQSEFNPLNRYTSNKHPFLCEFTRHTGYSLTIGSSLTKLLFSVSLHVSTNVDETIKVQVPQCDHLTPGGTSEATRKIINSILAKTAILNIKIYFLSFCLTDETPPFMVT